MVKVAATTVAAAAAAAAAAACWLTQGQVAAVSSLPLQARRHGLRAARGACEVSEAHRLAARASE